MLATTTANSPKYTSSKRRKYRRSFATSPLSCPGKLKLQARRLAEFPDSSFNVRRNENTAAPSPNAMSTTRLPRLIAVVQALPALAARATKAIGGNDETVMKRGGHGDWIT